MRPLGSSAHGQPALANLAVRKLGAARRGLLGGVLLAAAVFGGAWGAASSIAYAATLDLNGLVVTLPNTNSQINVNIGTLQIGAGGTTGSITGNVLNNTSLVFDRSNNYAYGGVVFADGSLTQAGPAVLELDGANTYTGVTTVQSGTLKAGVANALSAQSATTVDSGATLDLGGHNQTVSSLTGAGTVTNSGLGSAVLTNQGASSTFSGVIQDGASPMGLTQSSSGNTLTLPGANTYSGPTTVQAGTLMGGLRNTFSAISPTTVDSGGTLDLGGFVQTINTVTLNGGVIQNGQLNGAISGGGVINGISGSASVDATLFTTLEGSNGYTGATIVDVESRLTAGGPSTFSPNSAMTVGLSATLDLNGFDQTVSSLSGPAGSGSFVSGLVTNTGTSAAILTNQGASSTFSGIIQDGASPIGLTQNSPGNTLTLAGANTYSGPTAVQAGTLMGGATNAFSARSPTTVYAGGTLDLGGLGQRSIRSTLPEA